MNELTKLRALSSSPYSPEPPQQRALVDLAMRIALLLGQSSIVTPHLFGGSNEAKVKFEYDGAPRFWEDVSGELSPELFSGKDVLDAGCGWGGKTIHFAEHTNLRSISGFDLPGVFDIDAPASFARGKGVDKCSFKTGFAEAMPYEDKQFDVLLMEDVMEHVADPEKVVAECCRVLRPGGHLIVKFPSFKSMLAHHLDRAILLPGLHYMLPMRWWASGLNQLLLKPGTRYRYEPFDEIVATRFRKSITRNLNGMDFAQFGEVVRSAPLHVSTLKLMPFNYQRGPASLAKRLYGTAYASGVMKEFFSNYILLIAQVRDHR